MVSDKATSTNAKDEKHGVYILITQCLQNGFFLADGSRLCLPEDIVRRMLIGNQPGSDDQLAANTSQQQTPIFQRNPLNRRELPADKLKNGPLYQFMQAVTHGSNTDAQRDIHILNIRDWHDASRHYDEERRLYGVHCEAGTWEAEPLEGYEAYLAPWKGSSDGVAQARTLDGYTCRYVEGRGLVAVPPGQTIGGQTLHYYDVRSDSVFDFKYPQSDELKAAVEKLQPKKEAEKTNQHINRQADSFLQLILDKLIPNIRDDNRRVYVVVIGVYTDIKIKVLLVGLRTRYHIDGLFVSDVLTDSPTLERHLQGLDFVAKVAQVQVLHNLNDIASVLNTNAKHIIPNSIIEKTVSYSEYSHHYVDRQYVLSYQDNQVRRYLDLTQRRSVEVYNRIRNATTYLLWIGYLLLALLVLMILFRMVGQNVPDSVLFFLGFTSVAQILGSFFLMPFVEMRSNLNSLVRLRNYLESYSTVTALLRHHLTQPEQLMPTPHSIKHSKEALELLQHQLELINLAAKGLRTTFYDLAYSPAQAQQLLAMEDNAKPGTPASAGTPTPDQTQSGQSSAQQPPSRTPPFNG